MAERTRVTPSPRSFACDLATLCAPTLAGLKPASLFRYQPAPGRLSLNELNSNKKHFVLRTYLNSRTNMVLETFYDYRYSKGHQCSLFRDDIGCFLCIFLKK